MSDRFNEEILRSEVCRRYVQRDQGVGSSETADCTVIELNIGDFCDQIDESFVVEIANDNVPYVRLVIDSAEEIPWLREAFNGDEPHFETATAGAVA